MYLNRYSANKQKPLKSIFENIENEEVKNDTDISYCNTEEIISIIFNNFNIQRFSYFVSVYDVVMGYKQFCLDNDLVDKMKFYSNYEQVSQIKYSTDDLFKIFYNNISKIETYSTPDELYRFLCNNIYFTDPIKENEYDKLHGNTISIMGMEICFLMLNFYGIANTESIMLPRISVYILSNNKVKITTDKKDYIITGNTAKLIIKVFSANRIRILRGEKDFFKNLNAKYLLAFEDDNSEILLKKRVTKYKVKYSADCVRSEHKVYPTYNDITFNGAIYSMVEYTKNNKCSINFNDRNEILNLYKKITGSNVQNYMMKYEIIARYKMMLNNK